MEKNTAKKTGLFPSASKTGTPFLKRIRKTRPMADSIKTETRVDRGKLRAIISEMEKSLRWDPQRKCMTVPSRFIGKLKEL